MKHIRLFLSVPGRLLPMVAVLMGLLSSPELSAQTLGEPLHYSIRYDKGHYFYHNGVDMNVVDLNVEWPEVLGSSAAKPLQKFLADNLFHVSADNYDDAKAAFLLSQGEPVTRLDTLPEPSRYCYTDCSLRLLYYKPDQYATFSFSRFVSPEKMSSQKGDTLSMFLTYDIQEQRILLFNDIIQKSNIFTSFDVPEAFLTLLANNATSAIPEEAYSIGLMDACMLGNDVFFKCFYEDDSGMYEFFSFLDRNSIGALVKNNAKKLYKRTKVKPSAEKVYFTDTFEGENISMHTDATPSENGPMYKGGVAAVQKFLSENLKYPENDWAKGVQGKVVASLVIDKKGDIAKVNVLSPVSPTIDREAVRTLRLISGFTPASRLGEPVPSCLLVNVAFTIRGE